MYLSMKRDILFFGRSPSLPEYHNPQCEPYDTHEQTAAVAAVTSMAEAAVITSYSSWTMFSGLCRWEAIVHTPKDTSDLSNHTQ
jgi:hypothetical protein